MAVTLKIEEKKPKVDATPAPDLSDYVAEGERGEGVKAFLIWFVLMALMSVVLVFVPVDVMRNIGIGISIWWLLSALGYFFIAPFLLLRRLRLDESSRITARTQPRLSSAIAKGSAIMGVPEPEAYLLPEGISQVKILGAAPQFILVTKAATELLAPHELDALILRALVHSRENHVRRLSMLQFLADTPPAARILAWPISFYAALLNMAWHELAEQTADRLALIILRNPKIFMSAILKQLAESDPQMREIGVTPADVDAYIQQDGRIDAAGHSVSTQYKIGSAIGDNPYMEARIAAFNDWARSPEFQAALEKLKKK
jgi:Zn-dependent protease with chaperone function